MSCHETSGTCPTLLALYFYFHLLRLGGFFLRQRHRQYAVLIVRRDFVVLDRRRQRKAPHEGAIVTFNAVVSAIFLLVVELTVALQSEGLILDPDVDIF